MDDVIRTHKEINKRDPKPGYEWDAGIFPATAGQLGGRITIRLTQSAWEVLQVFFVPGEQNRTSVIDTYSLGEDGERAAKTRAREIYQVRRPQTKA